MLNSLEKELEERMEKDVELVARVLKLPLTHALKRGRDGSIKHALASAERLGEVYNVTLYDHDGNHVASLPLERSSRRRKHVDRLLEEGRSRGEYGQVRGRSVYSYFVPLNDGPGQNLGLLQVSRRKEDFRELFNELKVRWALMLSIGVAVIIVIVLLGYYGAAGAALSRLRRSMEYVQAGNRSHRADNTGPKEITVVASALNTMLDAINEAETQLCKEQESKIKLEKSLHQSKKLAAIGQLAAGVAHELGTPLSIIDGRAQQALRSRELPEQVELSFRETRREVRRMEETVRQLLNFAHPVSGKLRSVEPGELLDEVLFSVENERRKRKVTINVHQGPQNQWIDVNYSQALQAIVNLTRNAIQAAESRVVLSWNKTDEGVVITVDDDGMGVDQDTLSHLFEPFFTTKPVGEGTGLGLSIAYSIAKEHNGWIKVGEAPVGGSRFEFFFPFSRDF